MAATYFEARPVIAIEDAVPNSKRLPVKNGHRLVDPAGLDCRDDQEAKDQAIIIARQIATDVPGASGIRHVAVLNSERQEIGKVAVSLDSKAEESDRE